MPRLKPSDQEERNRIVRACIAGNQERQGIDDVGLAKYLGVVPNTVRNKKKRPETFTLRELRLVSRRSGATRVIKKALPARAGQGRTDKITIQF